MLPSGTEPPLTVRRLARQRGIALGYLKPGVDLPEVAVLVRDVEVHSGASDTAVLQACCVRIKSCTSAEDLEPMVADLAAILGTPLSLQPERIYPSDDIIRVHGLDRYFLTSPPDSRELVHVICSHAARAIDEILHRDVEAHFIPEATRSELLNELLLGDTGTSADSASRLRRADFPVDGSHCAIRVDCHDPVPGIESQQAVYGLQRKLLTALTDRLRTRGGQWSRAGTTNSIILLTSQASHNKAFSRHVEDIATDLVRHALASIPDLRVFVGIGDMHLGVDGLRQSVVEATTAARAARQRSIPNTPHHIDRLGLDRALLHWAEIDGVRPVVDEILAPLKALGELRSAAAIATLRAYLDNGRNLSATATTMHIHRNTARYRMDRIVEALDVDLEDPDERLLVELACRVHATER